MASKAITKIEKSFLIQSFSKLLFTLQSELYSVKCLFIMQVRVPNHSNV